MFQITFQLNVQNILQKIVRSQKKITWQINLFLKVNLLSQESSNRYLPEVALAQKLDSDLRNARNTNKIVL